MGQRLTIVARRGEWLSKAGKAEDKADGHMDRAQLKKLEKRFDW